MQQWWSWPERPSASQVLAHSMHHMVGVCKCVQVCAGQCGWPCAGLRPLHDLLTTQNLSPLQAPSTGCCSSQHPKRLEATKLHASTSSEKSILPNTIPAATQQSLPLQQLLHLALQHLKLLAHLSSFCACSSCILPRGSCISAQLGSLCPRCRCICLCSCCCRLSSSRNCSCVLRFSGLKRCSQYSCSQSPCLYSASSSPQAVSNCWAASCCMIGPWHVASFSQHHLRSRADTGTKLSPVG